MLTNSLLLCLRDLLPVFILFCYLREQYPQTLASPKITLSLVASTVLLSLMVFLSYESISDIDEGNGIEWLRIISLSGGYLMIVASHINKLSSIAEPCLKIGAVLLAVTHVSSFLLFFSIYASPDNLPDLLIGSAIGLAICFSFYTLLGFILQELYTSRLRFVAIYLWALFLAGQLAMSVNYMHQIGFELVGNQSLYNVTNVYNESSEYGHVLKAMFGFDASPSILYICFFALGFIGMALVIKHKPIIKDEVTST
jgi:high-affinity iron transporter